MDARPAPANGRDLRLPALRRFAGAISILTLAGHTVLGFEQSWATPLVGLLAAYATEIALELVDAWRAGRRPRFLAGTSPKPSAAPPETGPSPALRSLGLLDVSSNTPTSSSLRAPWSLAGLRRLATSAWEKYRLGGATTPIDFLLSAHISGLAVSMLLYSGERLLPIAFAAAAAIVSKHLFRVATERGSRHFLNPSNFGITATLLLFPTVGIAQPYMFTEKLNPTWDWILPVIFICAGTFLNGRFTHKLPLIAGFVGGFGLQAVARHYLLGNVLSASLLPLTGMSVLLFTFYMVTDPATTPVAPRAQVAFGLAVAAAYGALMALHIVFAVFFSLTVVCCGRGALLYLESLAARRARQPSARPREVPVSAAIGSPGL